MVASPTGTVALFGLAFRCWVTLPPRVAVDERISSGIGSPRSVSFSDTDSVWDSRSGRAKVTV